MQLEAAACILAVLLSIFLFYSEGKGIRKPPSLCFTARLFKVAWQTVVTEFPNTAMCPLFERQAHRLPDCIACGHIQKHCAHCL